MSAIGSAAAEVGTRDPRITSEIVRADFNSIEAVLHYTRAAHSLGLWESERLLIERFIPDRGAAILEAGCGAGRVTLGLWQLGYHNLTAFDFAEELLEQAISLAAGRGASAIRFLHADATRPDHCHLLDARPSSNPPDPDQTKCHLISDTSANAPTVAIQGKCHLIGDTSDAAPAAAARGQCHSISDTVPELEAFTLRGQPGFEGVLFLFNGLMQIPGRENRRIAMRNLARLCRPGAPFIFTTHDRDDSARERKLWDREREAWRRGRQDSRLVEFGDRYFESPDGRIFMHLPDQAEIRDDLAATGWTVEYTAMRREIAGESRQVRAFSDECRFWVARRA